jgi:hypothetical protein
MLKLVPPSQVPIPDPYALPLGSGGEDAMMQFARAWLAAARPAASSLYNVGDPFNSDSMHALVRRSLRNLADWHERNCARVLQLALAGAEDADQALRDLLAERNKLGLPLGPALGTFATIIADGPIAHRRPHSRPRGNYFANHVIILLIIELMKRFPELNLRRSSRRRPSACSIVSLALIEAGIGRGAEEAIRKIWDQYGPPVNPGYAPVYSGK